MRYIIALNNPLDNFGTVVGENPDCLLLSGTVVGENPDHVYWEIVQHAFQLIVLFCIFDGDYLWSSQKEEK